MPEHTELSWLLSRVTALGELNRMHQFRDKSVASASWSSRRAALLPGAAGRRRARLPRRRGAGRRGPARAPRAHARRRASASTRASARCSSCPSTGSREVGARIMDLQDPTRKMSTTGGTRAGHGLRARRARGDREEDQARGHRLRDARSARAPDKPGVSNLIEILAVGARRRARARSRREFGRRPRLRRPQDGGGRGGRRVAGARCASATRELRADEAALEGVLAAGRRARPARSPRATLADVREAMGVGPVRA